ncbi:MAG TPA: bacteriohopanetetrol glucosamine biosynthesis glycosyltransferase HpnI [Bryobacteraceae bacterium]|nr:bacteriohopanetetrol glucosamine biosynthesis glycosyltransferase HpnI [Bryobacteraceae bacterium]
MQALWLIFLPAAAYQLLATAAGLRHLRKRRNDKRRRSAFRPPVSVLKPLRGLDPNTYEAFVSQARQEYPEFEILFGVRDEGDAAVAEVLRLQSEFPAASIRLIVGSVDAPNGKVGVLMELARHARYPIWVINDSDIKVTPSYLEEVVAPLADASVGVVTCPYRANAHTAASGWESLGIATDFMPSALVAQLVGVREFGFGSTLAFRAEDLERAGGFRALADYIADDYQLAKRITGLGKRALLSTYTVETALADASWAGVWRHQLRWARTIRVTKGAGHAGLPVTHAGVWILLAIGLGAWAPAAVLFGARIASAFVTGCLVLRSSIACRLFWLAPFWDLYAFGIWVTSYAGRTVRWRDRVLRIDRDGKIERARGISSDSEPEENQRLRQ